MESTTICFLFASILSLFLLLFHSLLKSITSGGRKQPLPPGSLGWPDIGETFQLYSQNPNVFFASKVRKFGSIFKTHILGCPCVMISSPEAAKLVLVTKAHLFKPTFPASKGRMLGKQAIFFHQGEYHSKLRKLVLRSFVPESIKNFVSNVESIAIESLESWEGQLITTFLEMKTYTFNVALLSIFGKDEILYREDLRKCYYILEKGYNSMPINLPGTLFHKSMKAANCLNIKSLLDLTCQTVADMIKGKTPEICKAFNIRIDFTRWEEIRWEEEEEEEEVRWEVRREEEEEEEEVRREEEEVRRVVEEFRRVEEEVRRENIFLFYFLFLLVIWFTRRMLGHLSET